jgi:hypothetical protein
MRDTTQWRKDADQLRRHLLNAYRAGEISAIARTTQALEALLKRTDRPPRPTCRNISEGSPSAMPARHEDGSGPVARGSSQRPSEMPPC